MIITSLKGGLGNQMFQYSFGRVLSEFYKTKLLVDVSAFKNQEKLPGFTPRNYELDIFKVQSKITDDSLIKNFKRNTTYKRIKSKLGFSTGKILSQRNFGFDEIFLRSKPPLYISGYFQSEKYFLNKNHLIREIFKFPSLSESWFTNYVEIINSSPRSVSIHFRRGDYISDPITSKFHITCSLSYYEESIKYFLDKLKDPLFFIFSDDIEWVEKNIANWPIRKVIIKTPENTPSWVEMCLMSLCKNNIIANSSYSWWGAWLNSNSDKIVIAPEKWFSDETINTKDIVPESWIKRKN